MDCLLCEAVEETIEHSIMKFEGIRMVRKRHGFRGGVRVEEVLLFEGRTEEWVERGRLIESRGENVLRNVTAIWFN